MPKAVLAAVVAIGCSSAFAQASDHPPSANDLWNTPIEDQATAKDPNPQDSIDNTFANGLGTINDSYRGAHRYFNDDIIGDTLSSIGSLIGKWATELKDQINNSR